MNLRIPVVTMLALATAGIALGAEPTAKDQSSPQQSAIQPTRQLSPQQMNDEMRALRARLDELEAREHEEAVKAQAAQTTEQVIEDATRRNQMLSAGSFSAGYDKGRFYIGSEDGNFNLRPFIHFQFRDVANNRQDQKTNGDDNTQNGFEVRRLRIGFTGNMFSPDLTYWFNWGTQRTSSNATVTGTSTTAGVNGTVTGTVTNSLGGVLSLEEAWVKYRLFGSDVYIRGGQIRDPLIHDEIIGNVKQQAVERPIISDIFANGEGFTEAVTLAYEPKESFLRVEGGVNHGLRSSNTNFQDYPNNGGFNAYDYGVVGRAEFKVMGDWNSYNTQIGAVDVKNPLLVIGVAADYSERGHAGQTVGVVDAMYADPSGLSLYGAAVDRYTTHNFGSYAPTTTGASITAPVASIAGKSTNEYGAFIQAGYLIDKHIEPFGRFEYIHLATNASGHKDIPVIVGGMNYFFVGHRCKLTAQVEYLPKGLPFDDTPNDILAQPNGKGEITGQVQLQLFL